MRNTSGRLTWRIDNIQQRMEEARSGNAPAQYSTPFFTSDAGAVKPVCNDHIPNNIYYLWFIQQRVLMETEGTNLLLLTISAFWGSSRWPLAT